MANRHRGEIEAEIGGVRRRLVLTLGALAELEDAFGADDLVALTERFGAGRMKARDLTRIIGAGLRGAGESVSDDEVAAMAIDGGAQGYVRIAAALIAATFGEVSGDAVSLEAGDRLWLRCAAALSRTVLAHDATRTRLRHRGGDRPQCTARSSALTNLMKEIS